MRGEILNSFPDDFETQLAIAKAKRELGAIYRKGLISLHVKLQSEPMPSFTSFEEDNLQKRGIKTALEKKP